MLSMFSDIDMFNRKWFSSTSKIYGIYHLITSEMIDIEETPLEFAFIGERLATRQRNCSYL